jgi:hypothetical protein
MSKIYFKHPVIYDYLIGVLICGFCIMLQRGSIIGFPSDENALSITTDLATISLTLAGFVLTLLTVLITFKTGAKIPNGPSYENVPLFDLFFSTNLYFQTTTHLKGAIKSLVFIAILGFTLKLFLPKEFIRYLLFTNVLGLVIIVATLMRSITILTNIIALQMDPQDS